MKTLKRPLVLVCTLITVTLLISWKYFDPEERRSALSNSSAVQQQLSEEEFFALMAEGADQPDTDEQRPPAAEDVLVQKIPGDNTHLLLMAYYSKENFSRPFFTMENGFTITLRDDGKEYDKTAGDGLYTAKIPADVAAFRQQAMSIAKQMRQNGLKPLRYIHRELVMDPDLSEGFEAQSFDANQPISISGITNALSMISAEPASASSGSARSGGIITSPDAAAAVAKDTATLSAIKRNSVLITNLGVVEDPTRTWNYCAQTGNVNGPWTFGTLMRQLASKSPTQIATDAQLSTFVKNWLNTWATTQVVNGDTAAARTVSSRILGPWQTKSKNAGAPSGQLDMRFAPFKLTAIVNRFDLRDGQRFGDVGPCGEGRFVFCLINNNCAGSLAMTIIFEFGINKPNTCEAQHDWAQQWVDLRTFTLGSSQYNQALQNITDQFTLCGTNPSKPNQSSLNQLRTNEIAMAPTTPREWELREFVLDATTGGLKQHTVAQSPSDKHNAQVVNADVQRMVNWVTTNRSAIKQGHYTVPLTWNGVPFLGAKSHIKGSPTGNPPGIYHWDGTDASNSSTFISDNDARNTFSLETCGGCHAGEAQVSFTHVDAAFFGQEATLSGFLTGRAGKGGAVDSDGDPNNGIMTVKDGALRPTATSPKLRTFNEYDRRGKDIRNFVNTTCGTALSISSELMFEPLNSTH